MELENSRILIVDDIEENLKVLSETLTENGLYPLQAKNGRRALEIALKAQPDLILLDIKMPEMDGFQTIEELKQAEGTKGIPVIFISALSDIEDKIKGFKAGAVDYISKPFREEEVIARVNTHVRLKRALVEVEAQRVSTQKLLLNILPDEVAQELKDTGKTEPQSFSNVSILFSDFIDFTKASSTLAPKALITELNEMYTAFDEIMEKHGCERIKTIGDAYLAVCGMRPEYEDHAQRLVMAAQDMISYIRTRTSSSGIDWQIRIGINSAEIVGGIVGVKKYLYDIFGDSINVASRMESNSEPMKINLSERTWNLVKDHFPCSARDSIEVKGKGRMNMYFVDSGQL
jgi:adenylate cyclase